MYLWYSKKKGKNVGRPQQKKCVGIKMCRQDRGISAECADIWLSRGHVADMSATLSAKGHCVPECGVLLHPPPVIKGAVGRRLL